MNLIKTYKLAYILIFAGSVAQATPVYLSKFDALCAKCARNQTFRMIRKLGYLGAVGSVIYAFARYLNDVRNSSHADQVQFVPSIRGDAPELTIYASGTVIIKGDEKLQEPQIVQELKNPEAIDSDHNGISLPQMTLAQRFWRWLITPPHQAFIQYSISTPSSTKLKIIITHNRWFDSDLLHTIDMSGITGNIEAETNTGSIRITNPQGKVKATTQDNVEIVAFGAEDIDLWGKSIKAAPKYSEHAGHVFWNGSQLPPQQCYELTSDY